MASPTVDKTSGKPRRKRRWLQFGLPTLLGLVTVLCVVLGLWVQRAERQRRAVAAIRALGGEVGYDYEADGDTDELPGPDWLCRLLSVDYFSDVLMVDWPTATNAGLDKLDGLGELDRLSLHFNSHITDEGLPRIGALKNLRMLSLCGTSVTDRGLVHLGALTRLEWLNLNNTAVTDLGLVDVGRLPKLKALYLDNTQVTGTGLVHLHELSNLEGLDLRNTPVSDEGLAHVSNLRHLTVLDLTGTRVTDAGLEHLGTLTDLSILSLGKTAVTDAGVKRLAGLRNLEMLLLNKTVRGAGIRELRETLPNCAIYDASDFEMDASDVEE
jgi:hypothetical protein